MQVIFILCQIRDATTKQAIVNAFGSICEDIAGGLNADNWKTYDSMFNIMWNAVLFAEVYTPLYPPEHVLCHNWYLIFPLVNKVIFFSPNLILLFAIAVAIKRHYLFLIQILIKYSFT